MKTESTKIVENFKRIIELNANLKEHSKSLHGSLYTIVDFGKESEVPQEIIDLAEKFAKDKKLVGKLKKRLGKVEYDRKDGKTVSYRKKSVWHVLRFFNENYNELATW